MEPASKLKLSDVRQIFRLVGEVRQCGDDPAIWRRHMIGRLLSIFSAHIAISSEVYMLRDSQDVIDIGWAGDSDGNFWSIDPHNNHDRAEAFLISPDTIEAGTLQERLPIHPTQRLRKGTTFMLSQFELPHIHAVDHLGLHRAFGDQPFTKTDFRLLRLFHVELGRLWTADTLVRAQDPAKELPPRLSQTLEHLAQGSSEKQIAISLNLSRHTIHNYVKALHARFGVSSRGELLAKVSQARSAFIPQLSVPIQSEKPE